jgi:glycosidase
MRTAIIPLTLFCFVAVAVEAQPGDARESSTDYRDYRARTVYFLMADRFNPHQPYNPYVDPQYPDATNSVNCFVVSCTQETEFRSYWGGDIQGILQKMDYLNDLGVSAIWVTPLMENVRAYVPDKGYGTGYHGYWIQNYYRVNAHFGSWNDVNDLTDAMHARGMRYIQDITLNHSNPNDNHVYGELFKSSTADQVFIKSYDDDYDPVTGLRYYKHYQGYPQCIAAMNTSDATWSSWQLHHCLLADLSGYNQRDPAMANYLIGAGKMWIDNGVDDYRLDAVKFPFPEFIARYTHTMEDHLESLHRPAPYFVGEWSGGGVGDEKSLRFANNYDLYQTNILDFQLSFRLNRFIGGAHEDSTQLLSARELDLFLHRRVVDFKGRDTWQGTFLDNHDQIRTLGRLKIIGVADEAERRQRMDLGSVLLMTVRGIPIIYYGDEQYLVYYDADLTMPPDVNSGNDDPYNRPGLNRWDETTPAFRTIKALAELRKQSPAIWKGEYVSVYANQDVLVFERVNQGEVVLVAVNRGADATITLPGRLGLSEGLYRGLIEDASEANQGNYISVGPDRSTLHLNKLSSLVVQHKE